MMDGRQEVTTEAEQIQDDAVHGQEERCACAAEVNLRIWRSRCRVGWCDTSARLFSCCRVLCSTDGITVRWAAE